MSEKTPQEEFNEYISMKRKERFSQSNQLDLWDIIMQLEKISDKSKRVVFDDWKYTVEGLCSWRGSYDELAISYLVWDWCECYTNEEDMEYEYSTYEQKLADTIYSEQDFLDIDVSSLISILKNITNKFFLGYKWGSFCMSENTPVWIAWEWMCDAWEGNRWISTVKEFNDFVSLVTEEYNY